MDSTRDYVEAMALAVREHEREMGAMEKQASIDRGRRLVFARMQSMLNWPSPITSQDQMNALAGHQWWIE